MSSFLLLPLSSNLGFTSLQKRFVDMVKAKVDVDKTYQESKAGQHLSEAKKRAVIKEYM